MIWTGDPVEDFEIAKRLIAAFPHVDLQALLATAQDRAAPHSTRLASIYTLGFVDDQRASRGVLKAILDDPGEDPCLRDHAKEALAAFTRQP